MINSIIFDVGRVLVDFDWTERFRELGYDQALQQRIVNALFHSPIWNEFDRSAISDEALLAQFIANDPACEAEIRELFAHVELMITIYPHTMNWLKDLKDRGYKLYILSNYSRSTYEKSQPDLAFLPLTDGALFSFDCHYIKPEPEIYQELLQRFPIVPEQAVFIDDRLENLTAAQKFNLHTLQFTTYAETSERLEQLLIHGDR